MTIRQRTGASPFHTKVTLRAATWLFSSFGKCIEMTEEVKIAWKWMLPALMLLATGLALGLSPADMNAAAWYQSPVSPVSPVSPQSTAAPFLSPTPPALTSTQTAASPAGGDAPPSQRSGHTRATLIAGGIVLVGLIAGTVVLLMQGQPPSKPRS
jgi:predicted benzoate:H+ symporter BenE